ncbi:MAG: ATP-dependent RNA helicase RhlB [Gammaproteobacteria bacterium]|nr:ATP-dependent RNA helicase RhlB [Gammaproteobacteria bacterium]
MTNEAMPAEVVTQTPFSQFDLAAPIMQGLHEAGFHYCTPIQAQTLPLALAGQDIAGMAQTGTGKTAAFLLATFQRLLTTPGLERLKTTQPRALMLAPTRELAIQIHKDAELLGAYTGLKLGLAYGGTGYEEQRAVLEAGVDILIGTPGRIIDYFKSHVFDLRACDVVVLDEADRMFDLGFIKDIRYLLRRCPPATQRLGLLFSATLSYRVLELAYEHMNNPREVTVEAEQVTADKVRQVVYHTANDEKIPLLLGLMRQLGQREHKPRTIVFVNTKRQSERVWGYLASNGFEAAILSGDVPQTKRQRLLAKFQDGELDILVATDVAARGLHIPGVSHVFNYDLPQDAEDYVHRIGRTARLGAEGDAISFACEDYSFHLPEIEEYIDAKIPLAPIDDSILVTNPEPRIRIPRKPREEHGGRGGGRGDRRGGGGGGRGRRGGGGQGGNGGA